MNLNDDEAYDRKMEEIIVSLEVLDVIGAAVKRLLVGGAPKEPKAAELAPCDLGVGQKYPLPPFFQRADFSIAA